MPNSKSDRTKTLKVEVDQMFHMCEKQSDTGDATYLDIVRICDWVREQFKDSALPKEIEGALAVATGMMHPKKLTGTKSIKQGFGLLLGTTGGIGAVIGVLNVLVFGVSATTVSGMLWWKTSTVSIIWGGPVGIVLGLGTLAAGVFIISKKINNKEKTAVALDIIHKGIDVWASNDTLIEIPNIKWIKKLSNDEYSALLALVWSIINADERFSPEEARLIEALLKLRSQNETDLVTGLVELDVSDATNLLRGTKQADQCVKLLIAIPGIDKEVMDEEEEVLEEILQGMK